MAKSEIRDFYKGKNVLVTGGTGFFGKVITEKLIRSCDVATIYLIVRRKKGMEPLERLYEIFSSRLFDQIKATCPDFYKKVRLLSGDVDEKRLGLSIESQNAVIENVNIIFHCAAALNMEMDLQESIITNCRGTAEMLDLAKKIKNLEAFLLVSTAYAYCTESFIIEERFYEPLVDSHLLIEMSEKLNPTTVKNITKGLLGSCPNSYIYTKAVGEDLLLKCYKELPSGLFRPSTVCATAFEPIVGWTDNIYGPMGVSLYITCGVIHTCYGYQHTRADLVPVDLCVNALLCSALDVNKKWYIWTVFLIIRTCDILISSTSTLMTRSGKKEKPPVYNYSAFGSQLSLTWGEYLDLIDKFPPSANNLWVKFFILTKSRLLYQILHFFFEMVPVYVLDLIRKFRGEKPKWVKYHKKIIKAMEVISYFNQHEWTIHNQNVRDLWQSLSEEDQNLFNFDIKAVNRKKYIVDMAYGLKEFILKEDMTKLDQDIARYKRLKFYNYIVVGSFLSLLFFVFMIL